jgi:hypothetical protein
MTKREMELRKRLQMMRGKRVYVEQEIERLERKLKWMRS